MTKLISRKTGPSKIQIQVNDGHVVISLSDFLGKRWDELTVASGNTLIVTAVGKGQDQVQIEVDRL